MAAPTIVDLFSGCGGFGLGAELAGFHSTVALDIDRDLQSAYRLNFPRTKCVQGNIIEMTKQSWRFLIGNTEIDGVIGGPPCQGFSRIGKNDKTDPRRELMHHFFRSINIIKPKFFVMENVEGLLDEGNIQGLYDSIEQVTNRYIIVGPTIADASQFGVPTKRRRVVLLGFDPTQMPSLTISDLNPAPEIRPVNVKQAISDLPQPIPVLKGENEFGFAKYRRGGLSEYARAMRLAPPDGIGSVLSREMHLKQLVSGVFDTIHTDTVVHRFHNTEPGKVEPVSRYPRLREDGFCPTLRAGTGKDRGNFQAMRPIHPIEPRVITVREAARLQGFPDWFLFHPAKWHSFRMIGNSVSPILSKHIMKSIKAKLDLSVSSQRLGY